MYVTMGKPGKQSSNYRNIRLSLPTYEMLDKYLLKLMQERGDRQLTFDDAVSNLLKERG
jgi:hypothetical protein